MTRLPSFLPGKVSPFTVRKGVSIVSPREQWSRATLLFSPEARSPAMEERDSLAVGTGCRPTPAPGKGHGTHPAGSDSTTERRASRGLFSAINRNGAGGRRDTGTRAFCPSLSTDWVNRRYIACDLEGRCSDEAVTKGAGLVAWSRRPDIWGARVGIVSPDGGGARDASTFVELRWRICVVTG